MYEISHHQKNDVEITIEEEKRGQDVWGVTPSLMSVGGPHHYRLVSRDSFDRFWNTVKCRFDKRTNSFDEIYKKKEFKTLLLLMMTKSNHNFNLTIWFFFFLFFTPHCHPVVVPTQLVASSTNR